MMMGFPEWIVYVGMVPPLALTAVIALVQALRGFRRRSRSEMTPRCPRGAYDARCALTRPDLRPDAAC